MTKAHINPGGGQRLFFIQSDIHGDNKFGQGMQPGEPGIAGEELQEMVRRGDGAEGFFVANTLGINQRLVQCQHRIARLLEPNCWRDVVVNLCLKLALLGIVARAKTVKYC